MTRTISTLLAGAMTFLLSIGVAALADARADALLHARELTITAVVETIDHDARTAQLRGPGGALVTVAADASVRNFDQVKVGDKVSVTYLEAVAIQVLSPQSSGTPVDVASVQVAPLGGKPGIVTARAEQDSVIVKSIDYANRFAMLQMPDGTIVAVEVDPHVQNLATVKEGDHIVVRRTSAIAIMVSE